MSDQDFFFDEDEKPVEETKETKQPAKASGSGSKTAAAKPAQAAAAPTGEKTVTMTVAALIGVVALLVGVIIGIVIPAGSSNVPAPVTNEAGVVAPQLSPEQLETGELPEGHPSIGDAGAPVTPPAGETTPTE